MLKFKQSPIALAGTLALVLFQLPARAAVPRTPASRQELVGIVLYAESLPVGLARGQVLRVSLGPAREIEEPVEVLARARLLDARGGVLAQSAERRIPARGALSFDFERDALAPAGEAGTGRLQVKTVLDFQLAQEILPGKATLYDHNFMVPASLEVFDKLTGVTQAHFGEMPVRGILTPGREPPANPPPPSMQRFVDVPPSNPFYVGVAPGQKLRVSVSNPGGPQPPDPSREAVLAQAVLFDAGGDVIARSEEVAIAPGTFHSFDFDRAGLPLAGEAGTGRLQVRAEIRHRFFAVVDRSQITPGGVVASFELVDNSTGRTVASGPYVLTGVSHAATDR